MIKNRSKNEVKRQQILKSATQLFTENGYASTSMALIAKSADVSKQTVYSHFGNKEELFSASIAQFCQNQVLFDYSTFDFSNPYATLLEIAQRFFTMVTSKEALAVHKICAFESKTYPQLSELFFRAGPERLADEMTKIMETFHREEFLTITHPRHAAIQFLHMMKGEAWMRVEFNTSCQLSQQEIYDYLVDSVNFFIRGYAKR
ncbi:TetR/AcrR family transcriptional regulator [Thalassotalea atypica]|uniref:TetR/AcrR family transcriptional regulator n=1 Tax=Thalassotalea atypica TaxID=2054316 RepID=UPI002572B9FD|nr:TetR/AcrR family transcriptional regulator [Thalassotalea atypica]